MLTRWLLPEQQLPAVFLLLDFHPSVLTSLTDPARPQLAKPALMLAIAPQKC